MWSRWPARKELALALAATLALLGGVAAWARVSFGAESPGSRISNELSARIVAEEPTPGDDGGGGGGGGGEPPAAPDTEPVTETVQEGSATTLTTRDGGLSVAVPAGAVPAGSTIRIAPVAEDNQPAPGAGMIRIGGLVYEILVEDAQGNELREFERPLELTFRYDPADLPDGTTEEDLQVFYWDEALGAWIVVPSEHDPVTRTVLVTVDHLTIFALMAAPDLHIPTDLGGHWSETDVLKLVSLGIVHGYPDGTFRPDRVVTRAEFAKLAVGAMGLRPVTTPQLRFTDATRIPAWAAGYVATATDAGLVLGFEDGSFRPDEYLTREQLAVILARALRVTSTEPPPFADRDRIPAWAAPSVAGLARMGLLQGYPDGTFRPYDDVTRAEAATTILRWIETRNR